jgi:two-component system, OmpR family, sensor kinase
VRPPSLRRRLVLAAATAAALGLAVVTVGFNLLLSSRLDGDARSVLVSRATAQVANLALSNGRLTVEETPNDATLDQRVWVFAGDRVLEHPAETPKLATAAADLAHVRRRTVRDAPDSTRMLGDPVVIHGRRAGTVVAAVSLLPYRHSQHLALLASLALDAVVLLVIVLMARRIVTVALRPVAQMTAQAADWSEHDLDQRFALGAPDDELTSLAATLDALLGRLSASLRHEQRFSAEIAHQLRTPLAGLRTEAEIALRRERTPAELRETLAAVVAQSERMAGVIETLVTAAQEHANAPRGTADAYEAALEASAACAALAGERGVAVSVERPAEPIEVDADRELTAQILAPLIENAVRYGRSRVRVRIVHDGGCAVFRVVDDGPGIDPVELDRIFEPGARGTAGGAERGAGLGLALARRLAQAAGGTVSGEASPGRGSFLARLPAS